MNFPADLKYTSEHEWVRIDGDNATIGVTDFAQRELGDIVYVDVDKVGYEIGRQDVFGTVEAVKTVSDLFMPLSGTILELNSKLENNPELVNTDPYGDGWMVKVTIKDQNEIADLLTPEEYKGMIGA